jgi:hypothetical protein
MSSPGFHSAIYNVLKARTIGGVDEGFAPISIRNETMYPFAVRIGYENAEAYWADGSSYNYIKHISVPCLQIVAGDDMIVYKSFQNKLTHCIQNPNVMCVETKCGGHLGWQEAAPDSNMFGVGTSWADRATLDFFDAILKTRKNNTEPRISPDSSGFQGQMGEKLERDTNDENMKLSHELPKFRSKL